ncbi:methyltransferase (TIGR00027 family) [Actinoalloteichus hoggarensis]|uniref:S-adenosyl-L-methionine-dependent methyltransferase n=1 Tax=Actinoalloteichus hoggarensis TaxID=1470176 RepID=A0A221W522_9PSEU|nr:SAM-dependent methyltransferase [Actinoalloteichus hoggarensis]ASO20761.1 Putative S-adenosyl-L-methionine-dependent methyltransferase [Actinoalloteichus hoggarensis]MBB5920691.1 methyltransferase (TIGR00027 family) [Actinoalloteichus hoggarensis]
MTTPPSDDGVTEGVGRTALLVAAGRAIETHRADSLAQDPYAEHLVRAAPDSVHWPIRIEDVPDGDANPLWGRLGRYFGLRTRVIDDFLLSAAARRAGGQVVQLGAGLDTRPFRLDWPAGTTLFEIDREHVLSFKHTVLDRLGARTTAPLRSIAADLRDDWSSALLDAGFAPDRPSVWLAEGLLLYLPAEAERQLIDTVDRLTVGDGELFYEIKLHESAEIRADPLYAVARQEFGIDLLGLFDTEPRRPSTATLAERGWSTQVRTSHHFTLEYGAGPPRARPDALSSNRWVFADRVRATTTPTETPTAPATRLRGDPPRTRPSDLLLDGVE